MFSNKNKWYATTRFVVPTYSRDSQTFPLWIEGTFEIDFWITLGCFWGEQRHTKKEAKSLFCVKAVWEKGRKWNLKEKTVSCQGSGKLSSDYERIVTPQGQLTWFVVQEWEPWYTDCLQPKKPNKVLWQELRETSHLLSPSLSFTTSIEIDMLPFISNPGQGNEQLDPF